MGRCVLWGIVGCFAAAVTMCKSSAPLETSTPIPKQPSHVASLPPPIAPLDIPIPDDVGWMPMSYGADRGEALVESLSDLKSIALILPRKGNPAELEERVFQMVKRASPDTKIVARRRSDLSFSVEEKGILPQRLSYVPESSNGASYSLPKEHPLSKVCLAQKKSLQRADGVLIVRPVSVSDTVRKALVAEKLGDCSNIDHVLRSGIEKASAQAKEFEAKASDTLGKEFSRHLESALPFWKDELSKISAIAEAGSDSERCHDVYTSLLSKFEPCIKKSCAVGPRLVVKNGGIIGMPDIIGSIPDACPASGMRDYAAELIDIADRAVVEVLPAFDAAWATEFARLGGLVRGAAHIQETCLPRHRRVHSADQEAAEEMAVTYFEGLKDTELSAVWESVGGMEHVSGIGPVKVFARPKTTTGNPGGDAALFKNALKKVDRCGQQDGRVFQVSVIKPSSAELKYMGLFFEENLLCEGMLPQ